ncbi:flippase [Patescibacteria group bacterium]|nr:flippase [Patescibacteria group bacterium]
MKIKLWLFNNLTTKQTVVKNTFWLMLAEGMSKIPGFFLNIWIIRYLGAKDFGKISFIFALGALLAIFTDFGLSTLAIREIAGSRSLVKKYLDNLLALKLLLGLISLVFIFLLALFTGQSLEFRRLVLLAAIFVIVSSLTTFFQSIFQACEKMEYLLVSKMIYSIGLMAMVYYVIRQKLGVEMLMKGYIVAAIVSLSAAAILVRRKLAKFWLEIDFVFIKKTLIEAWPFALIGLTGAVYMQMNTIQLRFLAGEAETGLYNTAYQLVMVIIVLAGLFFSALFPTLSKVQGKSKANFYKLIDFFSKRVVLGVFGACLVLLIFSQKLFFSFYGPDYMRSINMFRLLLISVLILFVNTIYSQALQIMKAQKAYLQAVLWGSGLHFLLNFFLITWWGGLGASFTAILSSSLITILIITKFRKLKQRDLAK